MLGCGKNFKFFSTSCPTVILYTTLVWRVLRGPREVDHDQSYRDNLAGEVTAQLADRLKWDSAVMDWFAFASNITDSNTNSNNIEINVMLGDKIALQLTNQQTSNKMPQYSLENVVRDFSNALKDGLLYDLDVEGGKASVSTLDACRDMQCRETFIETKAGPRPTPPRGSAVSINTKTIFVWTCSMICVFLGIFRSQI